MCFCSAGVKLVTYAVSSGAGAILPGTYVPLGFDEPTPPAPLDTWSALPVRTIGETATLPLSPLFFAMRAPRHPGAVDRTPELHRKVTWPFVLRKKAMMDTRTW